MGKESKNAVSLSQQKLHIDGVIAELQKKKMEIEHQTQCLTRAMQELDKGEDMLMSNSILAQEVRNIMYEFFKSQ